MKTRFKMFAVCVAALAGLSMLAGDKTENQAVPEPAGPVAATNESQPAETAKLPPAKAVDKIPAKPAPVNNLVSYETAQVAKLAQTGLDSSVIKAYVENSQIATPPTVDEIIYLRNQGISSDTIAALIRRGNLLQAQSIQNMQATQAAPPQAGAATAPAPVYVNPTPAQNPVYVYTQPEPAYTYADYPPYDYGWPYYYGWSSGIYYSSYPYGRFGYHRSFPVYRNFASSGHGFNQHGRDFGRPGIGIHGTWDGGTPSAHGWSGGTPSAHGWSGGTPSAHGWSGGTPSARGWSGGTFGGGLSSHRGR